MRVAVFKYLQSSGTSVPKETGKPTKAKKKYFLSMVNGKKKKVQALIEKVSREGVWLGSSRMKMYFRSYRCTVLICNRHIKTNAGKTLFRQENGSQKIVGDDRQNKKLWATLHYVTAAGILAAGLSYAAVPLYRMFCQATSYGGTTAIGHDTSKIESMKAVRNRLFKVKFNADIGASMRWNFKPQQNEIEVVPGETALAFYTAMNPSDKPVIGISTYNVIPFEAGQYFNKIQCFCFEEQQLNPHEQVDMPVFFYLDPEIAEDPKLEYIDEITLSYTFFEAKEGLRLPLPSYATGHS